MTVCPTPANAGQLTSDDPMGGRSCVAYSAAYAICFATHGRLSPDGATIRRWTGDASGGLELDQIDRAVAAHTDLNFEVRNWTVAEHDARMATGLWVAVVIGGYRPVSTSPESGQPFFTGNHAWMEPPEFRNMDPLADGRRSGIYRYHDDKYPASLRHTFYMALRLGNGHAAGPTHLEAMYLRIEPAVSVHSASVAKGSVTFYGLDSRGIAYPALTRKTGGFSGACTPSHLYQWASAANGPVHSSRLRLVRMTSGAYSKGQFADLYLNANAKGVTVQ